jgi:hypothetical protein
MGALIGLAFVTAHLAAGRFTTNMRLFSDPHERSFLTRLARRTCLQPLPA